MPIIDPSTLDPAQRYRLMIGIVVPRPIAWITTIGADGVVNLAAFSFFMGVAASPPTIAVSIAHRTPIKDTLRNLRANGEAVVHLVPTDLLDACHQSGSEYAPTISEVTELGLPTAPATVVAPPRLTGADIAMECRMVSEIPVGAPATALCLLTVLRVHVADGVTQADGLPDPSQLRAVARLGDRSYLAGDAWHVVERARAAPPEGKGVVRQR